MEKVIKLSKREEGLLELGSKFWERYIDEMIRTIENDLLLIKELIKRRLKE